MPRPSKSFTSGCLAGLAVGIAVPFVIVIAIGLLFPELVARTRSGQLQAPPITVGAQADYDWSIQDIDGETVPFERFKGQVTFLHFWNPTCFTCMAEVPSINALYNEAGAFGVAFVAVTGAAHAAELPAVVARENILTPVYTLADEVPEVFRATGAPATFIIGDDGEVVFKHVGGAKWDDPRVALLLKQLADQAGSRSASRGEDSEVS